MPNPTLIDTARRENPMANARKHQWVPKDKFRPGGDKGKLHRELGIPEGNKIPAERLAAATRSRDPEIRRDATRAETMESWHHGAAKRRYARS
jgi:hypothetical protein